MQQIIARLISNGLLVPSRGSLLRILAWASATLVAASLVVPDRGFDLAANQYNRTASTEFVQGVATERGDQRGFSPRDVDGFRIAWTAGSSIQSINPDNYTFVPIDVRERVQELNGDPVFIDMYFLSGMRIFDEYGAVLSALSSDPDMLVVTLNPLWVLNDLAVQGWDNLDGRTVAASVTRPTSWDLALALGGPADLLWGVLGSRLDVVEDRYHWGTRLSDRIDGTTLLDVGELPESAPSELQQVAEMQIPVAFWSRYAPNIAPGSSIEARQRALFDRTLDSRSSFNESVLDEMLRAIRDSGVPAYVYIAPVDPASVANPDVDEALAVIEQRVAAIAAPYQSDSLIIESQSAIRFLEPFKFNDIVHLAEVGPLATHLADAICSVATQNGIEGTCP